MQRARLVRSSLLCLLALLVVVNAIVEADWWKDNWKRQFIGAPTHAISHDFAGSGPTSVIVATSSGAIASLSVGSQQLLWRRLLPEGEVVDFLGNEYSSK